MSSFGFKSISTDYLEAKSAEHIQSLLPLPDEFKAFRDLTTASLKSESSLPPLITRYIYRYIHSHELYQISTSNFKVFSELVSLLISNSGLPKTDAATRDIVNRCKSVIETAAQAWTNQGLLVVDSEILRKSTVFKRIWDTEVQAGGTVKRKQDGGVKDGQNLTKHTFAIVAAEEDKDCRQKKRVHFARPESSTNRIRIDDIRESHIQLGRHGCKEIVGTGATGEARPYLPSAEIPDIGDCIVVGTLLADPLEYSDRHRLTGANIIGVGEITREEMELYNSSNTASKLPLVDQLWTANPTTGQHHQRSPPLPCSKAGIRSHPNIPTLSTSSESVVGQEGTVPTEHEAFSTLTASQIYGDRCRPSAERATVCVERASQDTSKPLLVQPMPFTNQDHLPRTSNMLEPPESDNHSDVVAATAQIPVTSLLNGTTSSVRFARLPQSALSSASGGAPRSDIHSPKLEERPQNGVSVNLQLPTNSSIYFRRANQNVSSPILPPRQPSQPRHQNHQSSALSQQTLCLGPSHDFSNETYLTWEAVTQKLKAIGKILIPWYNTPDLLVMYPLDHLLSRSVPEFYHWYARNTGAAYVSALTFELLDADLSRHGCMIISRTDPAGFYSLMQSMLDCLRYRLKGDPALAAFRVAIKSPTQGLLNDTEATSRPPGNWIHNANPSERPWSPTKLQR